VSDSRSGDTAYYGSLYAALSVYGRPNRNGQNGYRQKQALHIFLLGKDDTYSQGNELSCSTFRDHVKEPSCLRHCRKAPIAEIWQAKTTWADQASSVTLSAEPACILKV
jgi:hypothetical protein